MLFSQALACCHLKEYDKAIQIYNEILNSGSDKKPWITKTGIVKAFWSKYQDEGGKMTQAKQLIILLLL